VKLNKLIEADMAEVYAKFEMFSPGSSVRDKIVLAIVESAEK